jgi:hypothetical protein
MTVATCHMTLFGCWVGETSVAYRVLYKSLHFLFLFWKVLCGCVWSHAFVTHHFSTMSCRVFTKQTLFSPLGLSPNCHSSTVLAAHFSWLSWSAYLAGCLNPNTCSVKNWQGHWEDNMILSWWQNTPQCQNVNLAITVFNTIVSIVSSPAPCRQLKSQKTDIVKLWFFMENFMFTLTVAELHSMSEINMD